MDQIEGSESITYMMPWYQLPPKWPIRTWTMLYIFYINRHNTVPSTGPFF